MDGQENQVEMAAQQTIAARQFVHPVNWIFFCGQSWAERTSQLGRCQQTQWMGFFQHPFQGLKTGVISTYSAFCAFSPLLNMTTGVTPLLVGREAIMGSVDRTSPFPILRS